MIGTTMIIVVTLSRKAEKRAVISENIIAIASGFPFVKATSLTFSQEKIPEALEISTSIIIAIRRIIVSKSMAWRASSGAINPARTRRTAPKSATSALSRTSKAIKASATPKMITGMKVTNSTGFAVYEWDFFFADCLLFGAGSQGGGVTVTEHGCHLEAL